MTAVQLAQLEVPDYDLGLRGKLLRGDKLDKADGLTFCTIIYGLSLAGEVTDTASSNQTNGYPDAPVMLDESTRIELPWRGGATAVIGDLVDENGTPIPASPRGQLERLQEAFTARNLTPSLGFEYEVWLFDERQASSGERLSPGGTTESAYSLTRSGATYLLASEFTERMEQIGIPVETFHSEQGPGFFEFALTHQPALQAADGAARARQYFRDLAAEHGLRASFMAKPYGDRSGAGCHVHSSLMREGSNVFASAPGQLSPEGSHYVAGLLETLGDFTLLLNPFVNSYKRIDKEMYVAEAATWGADDRGAACRVLLDTMVGARVEHRRPGADANPYLVATAILAGGLIGIQELLPLAPPGTAAASLPNSMPAAIEQFETSHRCKDIFGADFVQGYAATRRNELTRYEHWLRTTITDWETNRYLEYL